MRNGRIRTAAMMVSCSAIIGCLAVTLTTGCGDRPATLENARSVTGPIVIGRHLAYLETTRERATLVRPYEGDVRHVALGRRPAFMLPTPDHGRLLVVCKGWLATSNDEVDEAPSLHVVDPTTGDTETYPLGSPYDEVSASDDNRYAVAFFSANRDPSETEVFRNPNAVAIIDLESGSVEEKSVRSFGDVPRGVVFSPSTMAPTDADGSLGTPRTLAVVFATGYITILDVTHPERREVTVRLALPGMTAQIVPERMVFAPSSGTAYLRATGSSDIYVLTLATRATTNATENDFVVSINTLAAGSVPADVVLFREGERQKVLVANQQSMDLTVIDASTAEFFTIPVGDPVDRLLAFPPEDPQVAVVFSQASRRNTIHFLDLGDLEAARGRNLTTLQGAEPVVGMELIPGRSLALVTHDDDRAVMSVLDLTERTMSPFTGHAALADYAMTADGLLLAGFSSGQERIGIVDLVHLSSRTVAIDHAPAAVLTLHGGDVEGAAGELGTVVIDHGEPFGLMTVIPDPLAEGRESAFVLSGFLFEGLLDDRYEE